MAKNVQISDHLRISEKMRVLEKEGHISHWLNQQDAAQTDTTLIFSEQFLSGIACALSF